MAQQGIVKEGRISVESSFHADWHALNRSRFLYPSNTPLQMPLHILPPRVSRRHFLGSLLGAASAAGLSLGLGRTGLLAQTASEEMEAWALLSDTHIAADTTAQSRGINMADHLRQAVGEVLDLNEKRPFAGAMINGDCALLDGQSEDYQTLGKLIEPLVVKGIPMHVTLGNHDERTRIQAGLGAVFGTSERGIKSGEAIRRADLVDKVASCVKGRFCDWYLLDSLEFTNKTPGRVGEAQISWLERSLEAAPDRPAIVMVHHNPHPVVSGKSTGLTDTDGLMKLLTARRQVKALFFGHTHVAASFQVDGLHLVNLPACAYRFASEQPTGWTSALVGASGCTLTLFDTGKAHALHAQEKRLDWRT